jgi:hypothetical protein
MSPVVEAIVVAFRSIVISAGQFAGLAAGGLMFWFGH